MRKKYYQITSRSKNNFNFFQIIKVSFFKTRESTIEYFSSYILIVQNFTQKMVNVNFFFV